MRASTADDPGVCDKPAPNGPTQTRGVPQNLGFRCGCGHGTAQEQRVVLPRRSRAGPGDGSTPAGSSSGLPHQEGGRSGAAGRVARRRLRHHATPARVSLRAFLHEWLSTQEGRLRPTTKRSYEIAVRRISSHLGHVSMQALTPLQIERFYADLARPPAGSTRGLASKSIRNTHVVLRKALGDAERLGQVARSAGAVAKAPAVQRPEHRTWSSDDLRVFLTAARTTGWPQPSYWSLNNGYAPARGSRSSLVGRRPRRGPACRRADAHDGRLCRRRESSQDGATPASCLPRRANRDRPRVAKSLLRDAVDDLAADDPVEVDLRVDRHLYREAAASSGPEIVRIDPLSEQAAVGQRTPHPRRRQPPT
jgi:hypothetical protein